jgi:hypothetical protein
LRQKNVAGDEQRPPYPEAQEPQRLTARLAIVGGLAFIGAVNAPKAPPCTSTDPNSRRND